MKINLKEFGIINVSIVEDILGPAYKGQISKNGKTLFFTHYVNKDLEELIKFCKELLNNKKQPNE